MEGHKKRESYLIKNFEFLEERDFGRFARARLEVSEDFSYEIKVGKMIMEMIIKQHSQL